MVADGASKKCFSSLSASPSKSSQGAQIILCGQLASSQVTQQPSKCLHVQNSNLHGLCPVTRSQDGNKEHIALLPPSSDHGAVMASAGFSVCSGTTQVWMLQAWMVVLKHPSAQEKKKKPGTT